MATKSKRRPYHSGSVVNTGSGKWLVRVAVYDPRDGKRRSERSASPAPRPRPKQHWRN